MNVILIGNGPSALNGKFGKQIDSFDLVVRINNFVTKGYEDFIGSKTDLWIHNHTLDIKKEIEENIETVVFCEFFDDRYNCPFTKKWKNYKGDKKVLNILSDLYGRFILDYDYPTPSTGLCAILYLLDNFSEDTVTIYGFDSFKLEGHYFNQNHKRWEGHDSDKEKEILIYLEKTKQIKILH